MSFIESMKTVALPAISTPVELCEITFMVLVLHTKLRDFNGMKTVVFTVSFFEKYGLKHKGL
jgi:hypothetical protein